MTRKQDFDTLVDAISLHFQQSGNFESAKSVLDRIHQAYVSAIFLRVPFNTYVHWVFLTPVRAQGGPVPTGPPLKTAFPKEFCHETCTISIYTKQTINQKKNQKHLPFQNGGQYTNSHFAKKVT